jgi:hypothetical protein
MAAMRVPANVRLNRFTTRAITPVVLLGGLLLLVLYHFNGVLKLTQQQDDAFLGLTALSSGPLQASFQRDAGTDRPDIRWNGFDLITYADWSSIVAVDGQVSELWNNAHGYAYDARTHQIFATSSGPGWQVVEAVSLPDDRHATVSYSFVARADASSPSAAPAPRTVVLSVEHFHATWADAAVAGDVFTAEVPQAVGDAAGPGTPAAVGTLTVRVAGPAVGPAALRLGAVTGMAGTGGVPREAAGQLTSVYTLDDPQVDRLTPLGTETVTFTPAAAPPGRAAGAPVTPTTT